MCTAVVIHADSRAEHCRASVQFQWYSVWGSVYTTSASIPCRTHYRSPVGWPLSPTCHSVTELTLCNFLLPESIMFYCCSSDRSTHVSLYSCGNAALTYGVDISLPLSAHLLSSSSHLSSALLSSPLLFFLLPSPLRFSPFASSPPLFLSPLLSPLPLSLLRSPLPLPLPLLCSSAPFLFLVPFSVPLPLSFPVTLRCRCCCRCALEDPALRCEAWYDPRHQHTLTISWISGSFRP